MSETREERLARIREAWVWVLQPGDIDWLVHELESASQDTERLDWLEQIGFSTTHIGGSGPKDAPGVHSWRENGTTWGWTAQWISSEFASAREAIDAARKYETPRSGEDQGRIRDLEQERDALQRSLEISRTQTLDAFERVSIEHNEKLEAEKANKELLEALANAIKAAGSYRSDLLHETWDGRGPRPKEWSEPDVDRDAHLTEGRAALSKHGGTR